MDEIGPGLVDCPHLFAQSREVGSKNRGRDPNRRMCWGHNPWYPIRMGPRKLGGQVDARFLGEPPQPGGIEAVPAARSRELAGQGAQGSFRGDSLVRQAGDFAGFERLDSQW